MTCEGSNIVGGIDIVFIDVRGGVFKTWFSIISAVFTGVTGCSVIGDEISIVGSI